MESTEQMISPTRGSMRMVRPDSAAMSAQVWQDSTSASHTRSQQKPSGMRTESLSAKA